MTALAVPPAQPIQSAQPAQPVRDSRVDPAGVLTSRAILVGGLMPSVTDLAAALRALRGLARTEDVVGFAIPLEGDPSERRVRPLAGPVAKPRFDLMEFLMTAIDPHRRTARFGRWAPGTMSAAGSITPSTARLVPIRTVTPMRSRRCRHEHRSPAP